ncbi:hypothetical protein [Chryseolinea soli]|uniref:Uncharacterized protein n=1 Tax=Chryseolinea soli TaxID=2321403 RepID=A0A385SMS3_9BACT|nr:hypothetical protein [Chryseolinea soli]AYB31661.1 hypothetical protein D4L85_14290 [Chryseolinea soli]
MTNRELEEIKKVCNEVIDDKIKTARIVLKFTLWSIGILVAIAIPLWYFVDGMTIYRNVHSQMFPSNFRIQPDTVLITAYSKDFILRKGDPAINESGYLKFYAEPGQKVRYLISAQHRFFSKESRRRKFYLEIDGIKQYEGKSIFEHGGGLREIVLHKTSSPDMELNLHTFGFRLDLEQQGYDSRDEIFISCIILVFGKQYML